MRDEAINAPAKIAEQWRRLAARDAVIFLAGPIAELRCQGHGCTALRFGSAEMADRCLGGQHGSKTDFGLVRARLEWIAPGAERAGFLHAWLAGERIVAAWWPEIRRLARELELRGRIEDGELLPLWKEMRAARDNAATIRAAKTVDWLPRPTRERPKPRARAG